MTHHVVIPKRYCGPPDSGNGGYTCGILAKAIVGANVEVKLVAPPPLERELSIEHDGAEARLLDGETVIAIARPADEPVDFPADDLPTIAYDDAVAAAAVFDVEEYRRNHEFPSCYTCGPDRAPGDGLRIFGAPTDRPGRCVWPWNPDPSLFDDAGSIDQAVIWAALDCPSALAWLSLDPGADAIVLGRMAAVVNRSPVPNERLIVVGWAGEAEGRRRPARSAVCSEAGDVLAHSRTTWIVLTDEQRDAFGANRP